MKIAFRVDASKEIGVGHFMRCLTLADAIKQRGDETCFISLNLPIYLKHMLSESGHQFIPLSISSFSANSGDLPHSSWLNRSQHLDAQDSIQALSDSVWDWLVVDHYALDARWELALRQVVKKILVIDDIADRQHNCDALLDQNFYFDMYDRYNGKVPSNCKLLLGPRYALLRDEFSQLHDRVKIRSGRIKRLLVFFGGIDAHNYTGKIIEILQSYSSRMHVDVVIGAQHPFKDHIELACAKNKFQCHVQTNKIAQLMADADLAIGAGGSAVWERCCLGLPSLIIITADNQINQVTDASLSGLLFSPKIVGDFKSSLKMHLEALLENNYLRTAMSAKGIQDVDGSGVSRVMSSMIFRDIKIRIANIEDSRQLFQWRNHQAIRDNSFSSELIEWKDHQAWLSAVLGSPTKVLLIGSHDNMPVGVIRFDIESDEATVSIYLTPDTIGRGLGFDLLRSAEYWLRESKPEINKVLAKVLVNNKKSQILFRTSGYKVKSNLFFKSLR